MCQPAHHSTLSGSRSPGRPCVLGLSVPVTAGRKRLTERCLGGCLGKLIVILGTRMQQLEQRDRSIFGKRMRSEVPLEKGCEQTATDAS